MTQIMIPIQQTQIVFVIKFSNSKFLFNPNPKAIFHHWISWKCFDFILNSSNLVKVDW